MKPSRRRWLAVVVVVLMIVTFVGAYLAAQRGESAAAVAFVGLAWAGGYRASEAVSEHRPESGE